ncbi:MAG: glycosyltransferase [Phycisphaeraceae bacterium]|nr:glycosyltransferase [Phycisphaeraceae bacterium]
MSKPGASPTILFAGGGSGGHIHPGVAIAEQVRRIVPGATIHFICKNQPLDRAILEAGGWAHAGIDAAPFVKSPKGLLRLARRWGGCVRTAREIIRNAPPGTVRVVAMGGYVAAPVAQAARAERAAVTLVNLDAAPGLANRWIARHAQQCFTAACVPERPSWTAINPIVRSAARASGDRAHCKRRLGFDPARPLLLITGASQGARSINRLLMTMISRAPGAFQGWSILHQAGPPAGDGADPDVAGAYEDAGIDARVVETIDNMGDAWGACDLAVSRSGAGSVAEIWANTTPALLLPFPHHRDQHQRRNAEPLVACGGARLVEDLVDPDRNFDSAGGALIDLMGDMDRREAMRLALRTLGPADGAEVVAASLLA